VQVADVVSCLALQRPVDVIAKLVDAAVQSRGHIECVVKLLHRLPTLAEITTSDGSSVLLDRLNQQIGSSSQQMLQNITSLCRLLLVCTNSLTVLIFDYFG